MVNYTGRAALNALSLFIFYFILIANRVLCLFLNAPVGCHPMSTLYMMSAHFNYVLF